MIKVEHEPLNKAFDVYFKSIMEGQEHKIKTPVNMSKEQFDQLVYFAYAKGWVDSAKDFLGKEDKDV